MKEKNQTNKPKKTSPKKHRLSGRRGNLKLSYVRMTFVSKPTLFCLHAMDSRSKGAQ